jgi:hypothetical protein
MAALPLAKDVGLRAFEGSNELVVVVAVAWLLAELVVVIGDTMRLPVSVGEG